MKTWNGLATLILAVCLAPATVSANEAFDCDTGLDLPCTLTITPDGGAGLAIRAPGDQFSLTVDGSGFEIRGDIELLGGPGGDDGYAMSEASLVAEYQDPTNPNAGFRRLHGSAEMRIGAATEASPGLGTLTAEAEYSRRVDVGLELGSILQADLGMAYLNPQRPCQGLTADDPNFKECPYWFFQYVEERGAALGFGGTDIGLQLGAEAGATNKVLFVMDPEDFFIYAGATYGVLDSIELSIESTAAEPDGGQLQASVDYGLGFSENGYIPFYLATTYGIEEQVDDLGLNFEGHMVLNWANIPVAPMVNLKGEMVMDFAVAEDTGAAQFDTYQAAANGVFDVGLNWIGGSIGLGLQLGNASAGVRVSPRQQSIYISGEAGDEFPWRPAALPMSADLNATYKAVVVMVNKPDPATGVPFVDLTDSFVQQEGEFLVDLSYGGDNGLLGGGNYTQGFARVDGDGFTFRGAMGSDREATLVHPLLQISGAAQLTVRASTSVASDQLFEVIGQFQLGGETFAQEGILRVTPGDAYVGFPLSFDPTLVQQAYNDTQDALANAEAEVTRLNILIMDQRAVVQAERDAAQAELRAAEANLVSARAEVNRLNALINKYNKDISYYKGRIGSWYRWYRKQPWHKRAKAYARYLSKKAYYNGVIASRRVAIAGVQTAKGAATLALNVASVSVNVARAAVVTTPIDLDPRVAPLVVSRDASLGTINGLQSLMPDIPNIPGTIHATAGYRLNGAGLEAETRADYCDNGECVEIRGGTYDKEAGLACIYLPEQGNPQVCTAIPART